MERINFTGNKVVQRVLALGLGAAVLAGCANYSGNGNEFVVRGEVTDAGDESLKAEVYQIQETHGDANGWFTEGNEHRLHDNCKCHGMWTGKKQYGVVFNESGVVIEPSEVELGTCVEFEGKIRSHKSGKSHKNRPVYDTAQLIPCGL